MPGHPTPTPPRLQAVLAASVRKDPDNRTHRRLRNEVKRNCILMSPWVQLDPEPPPLPEYFSYIKCNFGGF